MRAGRAASKIENQNEEANGDIVMDRHKGVNAWETLHYPYYLILLVVLKYASSHDPLIFV